MSTWQIDPTAVQGLLKSAQTEQTALSGAMEEGDFESIFTGLAAAGDIRGDAGQAVQGLLEAHQSNLKQIASSVNAGIAGVSFGLAAYNTGNEDMRVNVHNEMVKSASSGDFSFFTKLQEELG